jgi:hypothetical protein
MLVELALAGDERAMRALYPALGGACNDLVWLGGYLRGLQFGQQQLELTTKVLRDLLPFARSRAEDMHAEAVELQESSDVKTVAACDLWEKADLAVSIAEVLLDEPSSQEVADAPGHS